MQNSSSRYIQSEERNLLTSEQDSSYEEDDTEKSKICTPLFFISIGSAILVFLTALVIIVICCCCGDEKSKPSLKGPFNISFSKTQNDFHDNISATTETITIEELQSMQALGDKKTQFKKLDVWGCDRKQCNKNLMDVIYEKSSTISKAMESNEELLGLTDTGLLLNANVLDGSKQKVVKDLQQAGNAIEKLVLEEMSYMKNVLNLSDDTSKTFIPVVYSATFRSSKSNKTKGPEALARAPLQAMHSDATKSDVFEKNVYSIAGVLLSAFGLKYPFKDKEAAPLLSPRAKVLLFLIREGKAFGPVGLNYWSMLEDEQGAWPLVFPNTKEIFESTLKSKSMLTNSALQFLLERKLMKLSYAEGLHSIHDWEDKDKLQKYKELQTRGAPMVLQPQSLPDKESLRFYSNIDQMESGDGYFFKTWDETKNGVPTFHGAAQKIKVKNAHRRSVEFRIAFIPREQVQNVYKLLSKEDQQEWNPFP